MDSARDNRVRLRVIPGPKRGSARAGQVSLPFSVAGCLVVIELKIDRYAHRPVIFIHVLARRRRMERPLPGGIGRGRAEVLAHLRHLRLGADRSEVYLLDEQVGNPAVAPDTQHHVDRALAAHRSEEHPSELQSLMRISYSVSRLQKKTQ